MSYIDHLIAHMQEDTKYLYLLEHKVKVGWFLIDFMANSTLKDSAAIWFPSQKIAVKFTTEEGVEEFRHNYISPRPVSIVKIDAVDHLRSVL